MGFVFLGFVAVIVFVAIGVYNRLIVLKNRVSEAWSDIDVQLKRRYDLIPNLVETVKQYASHEKEVFEKVTEARTKAMAAQGAKEKAEAENALNSTLKSLFAVSENYPDLKASQNFLELQREVRDTEDKVQAARRFYNGNVKEFNTVQEKFPVNLISSALGFTKKEFFEIEDQTQREAVKVQF